MTVGYQLTSTAENELGAILERIALSDGVDRALGVHTRFFRAFESLAALPGTGFTRPLLTGERVRWYVVHGWVVLYQPGESGVLILRVLHGAQDLGRILEADG